MNWSLRGLAHLSISLGRIEHFVFRGRRLEYNTTGMRSATPSATDAMCIRARCGVQCVNSENREQASPDTSVSFPQLRFFYTLTAS